MALIVLLESCASSRPAAATAAPGAAELAALKAEVMSADYRADFKQLERLRDDLRKWNDGADLAYLARYWSGFASWRIAMNGANHGMKTEELAKDLKGAAADFYASARLKEDFADAYAAASLVNGWLTGIAMMRPDPDTAEGRERFSLSQSLYARASALDPHNPRVLWAKAAFLLYRPDRKPEDLARAIDAYGEMLKEADRRGLDAASPLPDWGKPEALMSLAFAHTQGSAPELAKAREEAGAALKLVPEWSYVRDNLLPNIDRQMSAKR